MHRHTLCLAVYGVAICKTHSHRTNQRTDQSACLRLASIGVFCCLNKIILRNNNMCIILKNKQGCQQHLCFFLKAQYKVRGCQIDTFQMWWGGQRPPYVTAVHPLHLLLDVFFFNNEKKTWLPLALQPAVRRGNGPRGSLHEACSGSRRVYLKHKCPIMGLGPDHPQWAFLQHYFCTVWLCSVVIVRCIRELRGNQTRKRSHYGTRTHFSSFSIPSTLFSAQSGSCIFLLPFCIYKGMLGEPDKRLASVHATNGKTNSAEDLHAWFSLNQNCR